MKTLKLMVLALPVVAGVAFGEEIPGIAEGHSVFALSLMRTDCFTNVMAVTAADAGCVSAVTNGGEIVMRYTKFARGCDEVEVRVRKEAEGHWSWMASATPSAGWMLEELTCPRILLRSGLGGDGKDELVYNGHVQGFQNRDPMAWKIGKDDKLEQPGSLGVQFMTYYNPTSMFYMAAEDGQSLKKRNGIQRTENGLCFHTTLLTGSEGKVEMPYRVAVRRMSRADGGKYTWEDAADIYREWAERQEWCRTRFADRTDVPEWTKDAPVYLRLYREDYEHPERIKEWFDWFRAHDPDAPVYVCCWGWEKHGYWTGPDYFPVHPGDEAFKKMAGEIRARGGHTWPWPSGYNMIFKGRVYRNPVGVDMYEELERRYGKHMCRRRDGEMFTKKQWWVKDGEVRGMCGATEEGRRWFAEEVCGGLVDRGADAIQIDQNVGGMLYPCYARDHGHAPGSGHWMTEAYLATIREMKEAAARRGVKLAVSVEEPNEALIPYTATLDYRDAEWGLKSRSGTGSVFNYLYHEYIPLFQSNPIATNMAMQARIAVDGQMPVYTRHTGNPPEPEAMKAFFLKWVKLYRGEGRDVLMHGRHVKAPKLEGDGAGDVAVAAYETRGGGRAVALGNGSGETRSCSFTAWGETHMETLRPYELKVVRMRGAGKAAVSGGEEGWEWIDGKELPIEGRAYNDTKSYWDRLPASVVTNVNVNSRARYLLTHTSGMCFRFKTDATRLKMKWDLRSADLAKPHMPATGVSGIDVYEQVDGKWRFLRNGRPKGQQGNELELKRLTAGRALMVYLPLYNGIADFRLGVPKGAKVKGLGARASGFAKPVVFYGTSITQGGCASRPGMAWVNVAGRAGDFPVVGLGFAGSGRMEFDLAGVIARIDAGCYVLDCLWNMDEKLVRERFEPFVRELRRLRPGTPILCAEDCSTFRRGLSAKGELVKRTVERLKAEGWKGIEFLGTCEQLAGDGDETVDGCHPTDLGMARMGEAFGRAAAGLMGR